MRWKPEQVETLRRMWIEGRTSSEIAAEIGDFTRNAVMGKVQRLGLMGSPEHNAAATFRPRGCCRPTHPVAEELAEANASSPAQEEDRLSEAETRDDVPVFEIVDPEEVESAANEFARRYAAALKAREAAKRPRSAVPAAPVGTVVLSTGTMARAAGYASAGFPEVMALLRDLTGLAFDRRVRGHVPATVGIAVVAAKGDPRVVLCPRIEEAEVQRLMREMALGGMVLAGRAPERWIDAASGDAGFWEDMLSLESRPAERRPYREDRYR